MFALMERLERFYGPLPPPPDEPFALYVWEVLGVRTTPARRAAAMSALRRIPALTPDSMARAKRGKLEHAVAQAGPYHEERLRALTSGADVFNRNRDLPAKLRSDIDTARGALELLPHLTPISSQRMLLFAGRHPSIPEDPDVTRVLSRLQQSAAAVADELGGVLTAIQRATLYLSHHGRATCLETDPRCHICPLRSPCPFPANASSRPSRFDEAGREGGPDS